MEQKQVYDKDGTTFYYCAIFSTEGGGLHQWLLKFDQGLISIYSTASDLNIALTYPMEEHWVYEEIKPYESDGTRIRGAKFKTNSFTLSIDVSEFAKSTGPQEHSQGNLELESGGISVTARIPYNIALNIIKFASGSTDLDGTAYVIKRV
jgi:hypothetical protein